MTRRLTLVILGVVLATLVVTGAGTLVLTGLDARETTEADVRTQATASAELLAAASRAIDATLAEAGIRPADRPTPRERLDAATEVFEGSELDLVVLDSDDALDLDLGAPLPAGLVPADLDPDALRRGETVSGSSDGIVFASAAFAPLTETGAIDPDGVVALVVLTRQPRADASDALRWFLLSAAAAILAALAATLALSRRVTRPLRSAIDTTAAIAAGDLDARVPDASSGGDEMAELARSINTMGEALERSRGLDQQFLLSVSHDLRTPLTSIRGYAEAIADGTAADGEAGAAAEVILSESQRLERLVGDLLDLARLDARQFSLRPATIDLRALVSDLADGFRHELSQDGIALELHLPPEEVEVRADPDRLGQVVANLVHNALRYATSEVRLTVTAGPAVEVTDDGPGIAAEDLPHVFERLYQTQRRPLRRETGSGLGLAIVRELVTAMGGTVEAHSALGLGTRMVVALPSAQGELADLGGDRTEVDRGPGLDAAGEGGESDHPEPG